MMRDLGRVAAATVSLLVLQALAAKALLPPLPGGEGNVAAWAALSDLLIAAVMVLVARRMRGGWARPLALFLVSFGLQAVNLLEAVFFALDIPRAVLLPLALDQLVVSALLALIVDRLAGRGPETAAQEPRTAAGWAARLAATDAAFVATYFAAGIAVFPFVASFYAGHLPSGRAVLLMQVFRGLLMSGIVLLLSERTAGGRGAHALLSAVTFGVLSGVAPLIVPNPFMPDAVRHAHLVEVGLSLPCWAALAAFVWSRARPVPAVDAGRRAA